MWKKGLKRCICNVNSLILKRFALKKIKFGKRFIGGDESSYIVAEMSANHCGSFDKAVQIIHQAKKSGADAVKLQTFKPDSITLNCDHPDFLLPANNQWKNHSTRYSLYQEAYTPWEWHADLIAEGKKIEIDVFSSPFDIEAVDFLESLDVIALKIASPEITDIPLLKRVGKTGKPVILSTGTAELNDINLAVDTLRSVHCDDIVILKCTSLYPTPAEDVHLKTILNLAETFDCVSGISDHTEGIGIPVAATVIGGKMIEKHFMLDEEDSSVDAFFSLSPNEFSRMVEEVRKVELAVGKVQYDLPAGLKKQMKKKQRSLYAAEDIKKNTPINQLNCRSVRPGNGLHPKHYETILGRIAKRDIKKGEPLDWNMIQDS